MSSVGPKEAIEAIDKCAELKDEEKSVMIAAAIRDPNVAQGIVATPVALRVATIRQFIEKEKGGGGQYSMSQNHCIIFPVSTSV